MFWKRISHVNTIQTNTLSFSSSLRLGDTSVINSRSDVFAVQREREIFFGHEGAVERPETSIFVEPIPLPSCEVVDSSFYHLCPSIYVDSIDINGISSASIVKVGNIGCAHMEARVKNIRQLKPRANGNGPTVIQ
ncbi:hypothetical protein GCM10008967_01160 [Bacillus carboniphilus]|uniref:Spore germination protein GerPE n=1 Tax=Bacillus carboniphilus TaxID=86663 RepID=A0ABN0VQ40_9BACI